YNNCDYLFKPDTLMVVVGDICSGIGIGARNRLSAVGTGIGHGMYYDILYHLRWHESGNMGGCSPVYCIDGWSSRDIGRGGHGHAWWPGWCLGDRTCYGSYFL